MKTPKLIKKIGYKWINAQNKELLKINECLNKRIDILENKNNELNAKLNRLDEVNAKLDKLNELKKLDEINAKLDKLNELKKLDEINAKLDLFTIQQDIKFWELYKKPNETLIDAKKRFFLSLEVTDPFMKLKQDGDFAILKHVVLLCNKHNLKYWLTFGTLLGAIRHNGFVPWDDDVDISMPIEDFNKLAEILKNDKTFKIVYEYTSGCAKRIIKVIFADHPTLWYIDIFPKIPVKANRACAAKIYSSSLQNAMKEITSSEIYTKIADSVFYNYDVPKFIADELNSVLEKNEKKVIDSLMNETQNNADNIFIPKMGTAISQSESYFERSIEIYPLKQIKFLDIELNVPNEYHQILTNIYKDYYSLPKDMIWHVHNKIEMSQEQINQERSILNELTKNSNY